MEYVLLGLLFIVAALGIVWAVRSPGFWLDMAGELIRRVALKASPETVERVKTDTRRNARSRREDEKR